ncbi:MAG: 2,4-diaminopentanoate dehydrogenase [Clostridiales bacterium]|jgi:4-hydroxy-tetrahydrodipicolinate reductase|nr:2,4-diaminopentanoate dehydrogenase [Clostridiales bacterium]MDN5282119.1 2,4-diaminopentanoate dehydrogenase [Candidatus Ozemobacter sp.]
MKPIRVVQWGFGAMGSGMVKLMLEKEGIEVVGVIEKRPEVVGKDVGEALNLGKKLGIQVYSNPEEILQKDKVDVCLHAIHSFTKHVFDSLKLILERGINVVTIAEEMACPQAQEPELAAKLDEIAKANGVTILGTGVNPGFVLDQLVINLSGACLNVKRIEASRINDLSPFGKTVMETQGVGTTPEQFAAGLKDGSIVGHIGFPESIRMISDAIGLGVDKIEETREPIISNTERETPVVKVKPGMVAGCRHIGIGYANGVEVIKLIHPQQIHPEVENVDTGDYINIEGDPDIHMSIKPEIPGGKGTMAAAVNMIPIVLKAAPGLKRMSDLPIPACLMGKTAYERGF